MTLAVDFDGVIHDWEHPVTGRRMGPPMEGAKETLAFLKTKGYYIVIHSCNNPKVIKDWMGYWHIPYDRIWTSEGKPVCDLYIDDKAVHFTTWAHVRELFERV